jgi:hypothetical protein
VGAARNDRQISHSLSFLSTQNCEVLRVAELCFSADGLRSFGNGDVRPAAGHGALLIGRLSRSQEGAYDSD